MKYKLAYKTKNGIKLLTSEELLRKHSMFIAFTTREKGVSLTPYRSLNLSLSQGDNPQKVWANRRALLDSLDLDYSKLTVANQVHGNSVAPISADDSIGAGASEKKSPPVAGSFCLRIRNAGREPYGGKFIRRSRS